MNTNQCAPKFQKNKKDSCFNYKSLQIIAKNINSMKKYPKIKISADKKTLWESIHNILKNKCNKESCWINVAAPKKIENQLLHHFKPIIPKSWVKNKYEWLSTVDIDNVLDQYEEKYQDFKFIGPVPIDFDNVLFGSCIVNELCNINIIKMEKQGVNHIGIIFNLDKHNESGSHWVALFIELSKQPLNNKVGAYFYDSYGTKPYKEIQILMNRLKDQYTRENREFILKYNKVRHQYKNSECGVYSTYFIIKMLEGNNFETHCNNKITDDEINEKRNVFFRNN